ncbi:hypothetical protein BROUX41_002961 [Berkeleyomyces rouxiae]|uniref:uncharacterized protein n=1 Tax=Berkeleyomyces rouxiae TaxID=2035830 RepID=UPI003B7AFA40
MPQQAPPAVKSGHFRTLPAASLRDSGLNIAKLSIIIACSPPLAVLLLAVAVLSFVFSVLFVPAYILAVLIGSLAAMQSTSSSRPATATTTSSVATAETALTLPSNTVVPDASASEPLRPPPSPAITASKPSASASEPVSASPAPATAREAATESLNSVGMLLAKIRDLFSITIKATFQISSSNVHLSLQAIGATAAVVIFLNLEIGYKLLRLWLYALATLQRIVRDLAVTIALSLTVHYNLAVTSIARSRLARALWLDLFIRYLIIGPRLPDDIREAPEIQDPSLNQKHRQQARKGGCHLQPSGANHGNQKALDANHTRLQSGDHGPPMCPPYSPDFHATDLLCHPQPQPKAQPLSQVATRDSLRATSHTTSAHGRSFSL